MLPFPEAEYKARFDAVQARMRKEEVDALLVLSEASMVYLTGYEGFSDYVPQVMLLTADHESPILILREMDITCATETTRLADRDLMAYDERILGLSNVPVWRRVGELARSRTKARRIAVEKTAPTLNVDGYAALLEGLGASEGVDPANWIVALRGIKSPAELAYMREAATIVDMALSEGIGMIAPGVRECDVGARIVSRLCAGTPTIPGSAPRSLVTMPTGRIANAPHLPWSDRAFEVGSQTNFEVGAYRHRYCCALSRTSIVGKPSARLAEIDKVVRGAFEETIPAMRAGTRCSEVYDTFWRAFSPHGVRKESRIGYGIGIDWSESSYSLQRDDPRPLPADATVHVIVGIWEREEGYVFSETIRITESGGETFSKFPRQLMIV